MIPQYVKPLFLGMLIWIIFPPFSQSQQKNHEPLATIGGREISFALFQNEINHRIGTITTKTQKQAVLQELVDHELLYSAALQSGYDKDPEVLNQIRFLIVNKYRREKLDPILAGIKVTDAEIEEHYQKHPEKFTSPLMIRAAIIRISVPSNASAGKRAELLQKAEDARKKALMLSPETLSFGSVAVHYSDHQSSRYRGGNIGWIEPGKDSFFDKEVTDGLLSLSTIGEVSPVIPAPSGFYLVKWMEIKKREPLPFDIVKEKVRHQLMNEKKEAAKQRFMQALKADIPVTVFQDRLDALQLPHTDASGISGLAPANPGE